MCAVYSIEIITLLWFEINPFLVLAAHFFHGSKTSDEQRNKDQNKKPMDVCACRPALIFSKTASEAPTYWPSTSFISRRLYSFASHHNSYSIFSFAESFEEVFYSTDSWRTRLYTDVIRELLAECRIIWKYLETN